MFVIGACEIEAALLFINPTAIAVSSPMLRVELDRVI